MTRFLYAVFFVVLSLACSDPPVDPTVNPPVNPPSDPAAFDAVWANPATCDSNALAVSLPAAKHDSLPSVPYPGPLTLDESWYLLSPHVPGGWAGVYLTPVNGRNTNVLMFVDTTNLAAALDSVTVNYHGSHRSFARDSVLIRKVRWSWVQLYDWYSYILVVAGLPNVWTTSDIDETQNRLAFGAATTTARDSLLQRLRQLNAPCWLAMVEYRGPASFSSSQPPAASGIISPGNNGGRVKEEP